MPRYGLLLNALATINRKEDEDEADHMMILSRDLLWELSQDLERICISRVLSNIGRGSQG